MTVATIGDRLKAARKLAGLQQKELSERSGVDQGNISRLESNKRDGSGMTAAAAEGLANALGVTVAWLMRGEGNGPPVPVQAATRPVAAGDPLHVRAMALAVVANRYDPRVIEAARAAPATDEAKAMTVKDWIAMLDELQGVVVPPEPKKSDSLMAETAAVEADVKAPKRKRA